MDNLVQLVVFDMAGTTVVHHGEVHRSLQNALKQEEVMISYDEANAVMGRPKPAAIRELLRAKGVAPVRITDAYVDQIHQDFVQRMIDYYRTDEAAAEKDGVRITWENLRQRGVKVALDTGFNRPIADAIIARLDWTELLDTSVTSDEVNHGRPRPDMIFRAMERVGVADVKKVAKVGDTPSDMQQGTAAGCPWVVGVTTGTYGISALENEPHTHLIKQLPELLEILDLTVSAR